MLNLDSKVRVVCDFEDLGPLSYLFISSIVQVRCASVLCRRFFLTWLTCFIVACGLCMSYNLSKMAGKICNHGFEGCLKATR